MSERILSLLNRASILADAAAQGEPRAGDPYTKLAQLIDSAIAHAEAIKS